MRSFVGHASCTESCFILGSRSISPSCFRSFSPDNFHVLLHNAYHTSEKPLTLSKRCLESLESLWKGFGKWIRRKSWRNHLGLEFWRLSRSHYLLSFSKTWINNHGEQASVGTGNFSENEWEGFSRHKHAHAHNSTNTNLQNGLLRSKIFQSTLRRLDIKMLLV